MIGGSLLWIALKLCDASAICLRLSRDSKLAAVRCSCSAKGIRYENSIKRIVIVTIISTGVKAGRRFMVILTNRQSFQSGPNTMPSAGSVTYHQVSGLIDGLTVRELPSPIATDMPAGSMDCGRLGSHSFWLGADWNFPWL